MSKWTAVNNGTGGRTYFLVREDGSEYRYASNGNLIRYRSFQTASLAADNLNREEAKP